MPIQFDLKFIWMNRMSIKIIVMILFGIQMKTVLGCKNQQEKVSVSSLSMQSLNLVGFPAPSFYLRAQERLEIITGK